MKNNFIFLYELNFKKNISLDSKRNCKELFRIYKHKSQAKMNKKIQLSELILIIIFY